jgi:DNA-binding SARP family transcriptional activator
LDGDAATVTSKIDRMLACCEAEGEKFTETLTCIRGVEVAVALREHAYARDLSERGAALALETGSPVLLWLAELVQAQACLAVGDVDRASKTAERLLPRVEAIAAMGHVLHARLILAEIALRDGDLAAALEHVAAVAEYVVDKTPGLLVASYVRSFPDLLGPLAHVIGIERIPKGVLRCLAGAYGDEALAAAAGVLTKPELCALRDRMQAESGRAARSTTQAAADGDPIVEVRLFGGLEVRTSRGVVAQRDWGKRKARLLFAMLVARHGTDVHRAELIDYLWPELDEAHGVNNFYVVWSAMKRAVAPGSTEDDASRPFENHNGVCRVISGRVVSDLDLFTKARDDARRAKDARDATAEVIALRTAIEMYRGDVLPGDIYDDWFGGIRQRFRQEYQASVVRFATLMIEKGDPLAALPFVIEASERDPLREDLYQVRIKLEVASNQRGAAMGTYMSCRNTLVEELGIDPSRETVELYQQILAMEDGPGLLES